MRQEYWPWVMAGLTVVVVPLMLEWIRRQPPRSGRRWIGWGQLGTFVLVATAFVLWLDGLSLVWLAVLVGGGVLVAAVPTSIGLALVRDEQRRDEENLRRPERLALGEPRLWVRPRQLEGEPPRGIAGRVDRWLAADGPAPTAGWWHNGGLIVDDRGPALVDAVGLRHGLPAATAAMVLVTAPKSVLLVDERESLLARLPTTGFDEPGLRRFAVAAGWACRTGASPGRMAEEAVDLRSAVVDRAARDRRTATRSRGVLRRDR
jgi:hypothetical protein